MIQWTINSNRNPLRQERLQLNLRNSPESALSTRQNNVVYGPN